jgi:hypothetical protein
MLDDQNILDYVMTDLIKIHESWAILMAKYSLDFESICDLLQNKIPSKDRETPQLSKY